MKVLIVHLSLNIFRVLNEDEMGVAYEKDLNKSKEEPVCEFQT
jgi:hypothetical protein